MRVVIDSNIFIEDFSMKSNTFRVFLSQIERTGHNLIMSQVVFDEVINKFTENIKTSKRNIDSILAKVRSITNQDFDNPINEELLENIVREYGESLRAKLNSIHTVFANYPNVNHHVVVDRALKRRKPFNNEGQKGYRDTLIWETILQLARHDQTAIAFISKNKSDFADKDSNLHRDLQDDIQNMEENHCEVIYFHDLGSFVESQIRPLLTELDNIAAQLVEGEYRDLNLYNFLFHEITDYVGSDFLEPGDLAFQFEFENPSLWNIEDIHNIYEIDVRSLEHSNLLVTFFANIDAVFDFYIRKSDLYGIDDVERKNFEVWDSDWNEYYVWAIKEIKDVALKVSLIYDDNNSRIVSAELLDVKVGE